jgi:hypothetical protein
VGKISFGAFPRSGSHFFVYLTDCNWLDHRIKPLGREPNVAVSIRNPTDCIASWINLCNDQRADRVKKTIDWYCDYYLACESLGVPIVWFDQLILDPHTCIGFVDRVYQIKTTIRTNWEIETNFHYPTQNKSAFPMLKIEIENSPDFAVAQAIYDRLAVAIHKAPTV